MQDERLRLLALWHGRRRDVDSLLEPLLSHGPVAVARVSSHLDELVRAVESEQASFEVFRQACVDAQAAPPLPRDDLARGRARSQLPPPEWAREMAQDATVLRLPERP